MSMIRKRSHSNTNVSKKEKPPQQESGTAHPALSRGDDSLGAAGTAGEGELWGQVVMQMLRIVNVDCCSPCPSVFVYISAQKRDCGLHMCALR